MPRCERQARERIDDEGAKSPRRLESMRMALSPHKSGKPSFSADSPTLCFFAKALRGLHMAADPEMTSHRQLLLPQRIAFYCNVANNMAIPSVTLYTSKIYLVSIYFSVLYHLIFSEKTYLSFSKNRSFINLWLIATYLPEHLYRTPRFQCQCFKKLKGTPLINGSGFVEAHCKPLINGILYERHDDFRLVWRWMLDNPKWALP